MIKSHLVNLCNKAFRTKSRKGLGSQKIRLITVDESWKDIHALFNAVIENSDGYVWCIDSKRRYIAFNSAVRDAIKGICGIDIKQGDKAYGVLEAMDPSRIDEWKNLYQFGFQGKPQQVVHEFSIYGQTTFFHIRLNPIKSGTKTVGLSCYAKDITQQMLYGEQLKTAVAKARIETKEKERDEIGKELHDNVNQMLVSANMYLGHALKYPIKEKELVHKTIEFINSAIREIRRLSSTLISPLSSDKSLTENIKTLIDDIEFIQGKYISQNLETLDETSLRKELRTCIFRIVQEQLSNIIKYADASEVMIQIVQKEKLVELSITDNGKGFDATAKRNGIGISNIIDRAKANNGSVTIDSAPGKGCKLIVKFSILEENANEQ